MSHDTDSESRNETEDDEFQFLDLFQDYPKSGNYPFYVVIWAMMVGIVSTIGLSLYLALTENLYNIVIGFISILVQFLIYDGLRSHNNTVRVLMIFSSLLTIASASFDFAWYKVIPPLYIFVVLIFHERTVKLFLPGFHDQNIRMS